MTNKTYEQIRDEAAEKEYGYSVGSQAEMLERDSKKRVFKDAFDTATEYWRSLAPEFDEYGYEHLELPRDAAKEQFDKLAPKMALLEVECTKYYRENAGLASQLDFNNDKIEKLEAKRDRYKNLYEEYSQEVDELQYERSRLRQQNEKYRAALEWIKESGEILYRNELANEPYVKLVLEYRKHKTVAAQALEGGGG